MPFFHQFIPKLRPSSYTIMNSLNFVISEKSLYYLFALQLVFSDGMNSAIPSLAGILAYYTYSIDGLGLNEYRIPGFIEGIFKTCGGFVCSLIPMVEPNFNARVRGDANVNRMLARATAGFGGPGHGPGQSQNSELKIQCQILKKRTWSDTIIKQATPPPPNFFNLHID